MESSTSDSPVHDQATGAGNVGTPNAVSNAGNVAGPVLPPLSSEDFKVYNRMAEQMDYFVGAPCSSNPSILVLFDTD